MPCNGGKHVCYREYTVVMVIVMTSVASRVMRDSPRSGLTGLDVVSDRMPSLCIWQLTLGLTV